jgi:hypothetical protein
LERHQGRIEEVNRPARTLPGLALFVSALVIAATGRGQEQFVPLFDGTLKGWVAENSAADTFTVSGSVLRVEGPSGWLRTERQFTDFTARVQFRFLTVDADSGIFLRTTGATQFIRGWPNNAYQVQLRNPAAESRFPPVGGLFRHGMPPGEITFDEKLAAKLTRPTGEWQDLALTVAGETIVVRLNGTEITRATNIVRQPGYIGLQAELGALEFRVIEAATTN